MTGKNNIVKNKEFRQEQFGIRYALPSTWHIPGRQSWYNGLRQETVSNSNIETGRNAKNNNHGQDNIVHNEFRRQQSGLRCPLPSTRRFRMSILVWRTGYCGASVRNIETGRDTDNNNHGELDIGENNKFRPRNSASRGHYPQLGRIPGHYKVNPRITDHIEDKCNINIETGRDTDNNNDGEDDILNW